MKNGIHKRLLSVVLAVLLMAGLIPSASAASDGFTDLMVEVTFKQTEARSILDMVNEMRTNGKAWVRGTDESIVELGTIDALSYSKELEAIAMQRAAEIAVYYSHTRPDGSSCFTCTSGGVQSYGENIAIGYPSAGGVFEGWSEEYEPYSGQGHRRNMLASRYKSIGIACVDCNGTLCWVQEFGIRTGSAADAPNDSLTSVKVTVDDTLPASVSLTADPDYLEFAPGKSVPAPVISGTFRNTQSICSANASISVRSGWVSDNPEIAAVVNGEIQGVSEGDTVIRNTALGRTLTVPVKVTSHVHSYDIITIIREPDCTEKGIRKCECSCGKYYTEEIPENGHAEALIPGKPATCTEKGITDGVYCSTCNCIIVRQSIIDPLGHDFVNHVCSRCGCAEPEFIASGTCGDSLEWTLDAEGVLTVSGNGKMSNYSFSYTKHFGYGYQVTQVVANNRAPWQEYADSITSVVISHGVRSIGFAAFAGCRNLKSISISYDVSSIGLFSFTGCTAVENVDIDADNMNYSSQGNCISEKPTHKVICGFDCSLIPSDTVYIGDDSFRISEMTDISIPKSVTQIGEEAFEFCLNLESVRYDGTENEWNNIVVAEGNDPLTAAGKVFNSKPVPMLTRVAPVKETCTAAGNKEYWYDAETGEYYSDKNAENRITAEQTVIPASGHTEVTIPGTEPTCTESGLSEGKRCTVCGETTVTQQEIKATGHAEVEIPAVAPTCTEPGRAAGTRCTVCGKVISGMTGIPASGHTCEHHDAREAQIDGPGNIEYWQCETCGKYYSDAGFTDEITEEQIVVPAIIPASRYSVIYNGNKGTDEFGKTSRTVTGIAYDADFNLEANEFIRPGYVFTGWNTRADGKGAAYESGQQVRNLTAKKNGKFTLYARWRATEYTISFDANGGEYDAPDMRATYDKSVKLPSVNPVRKGYTFLGWSMDQDAVKAKYKSKASVRNLTAKDGDNVVLYSIWQANTYTVVYNANGGKPAPTKQTLTVEERQVYITIDEPVFAKYTFTGWNTKKDGSGTQYKAGDIIAEENYPARNKGTITLYAMWEYDVVLDSGVGQTEAVTLKYNVNEAPAPAFEKNGYYIAGWATSRKNADKGTIKYKANAVKNAASHDTLYAVWKGSPYTVTFDANGGTGKMKAQKLTWDKETALTANAFKNAGMKFAGWALTPEGDILYTNKMKVKNLPGDIYNDSITIYAIWQ